MKRIIVLVGLLVCSGYASSQQTLTLEECRNLAIQNNKELQMSGEKVKAANEERKAAFTKYFPQLSAMGGYMWNQKDINLLDMDALSAKLGSALGPLAQLPVFGQINGRNCGCATSGCAEYLGGRRFVGSTGLYGRKDCFL